MVVHGISADRAFEVLVEQTPLRNFRATAIAVEVVPKSTATPIPATIDARCKP